MNIERIGNTLATATTLMLVGLSVAFAFKTGLFNIGASGQMLIGGLCAALVAHKVFLPATLSGGAGRQRPHRWALWGDPRLPESRFNVHEVVATNDELDAYWSIYYFGRLPQGAVARRRAPPSPSASRSGRPG